jgi:hypothetical protein
LDFGSDYVLPLQSEKPIVQAQLKTRPENPPVPPPQEVFIEIEYLGENKKVEGDLTYELFKNWSDNSEDCFKLNLFNFIIGWVIRITFFSFIMLFLFFMYRYFIKRSKPY